MEAGTLRSFLFTFVQTVVCRSKVKASVWGVLCRLRSVRLWLSEHSTPAGCSVAGRATAGLLPQSFPPPEIRPPPDSELPF